MIPIKVIYIEFMLGLRKTTLMLLAELLNDNSAIQNKFC